MPKTTLRDAGNALFTGLAVAGSTFGTKRSLVQIHPLRPFSARDEEYRAHSPDGVSTGVRLGLINRGSGLLQTAGIETRGADQQTIYR